MIELTISRSTVFVTIPSTNERSILSSATLSWRSRCIDEWPVPKSSIDSSIPAAVSSSSVADRLGRRILDVTFGEFEHEPLSAPLRADRGWRTTTVRSRPPAVPCMVMLTAILSGCPVGDQTLGHDHGLLDHRAGEDARRLRHRRHIEERRRARAVRARDDSSAPGPRHRPGCWSRDRAGAGSAARTRRWRSHPAASPTATAERSTSAPGWHRRPGTTLPLRLAAYIAMSAWRITAARSSSPPVLNATPIESDVATLTPLSDSGCEHSNTIRSIVGSTWSTSETCGTMIANSSPPSRASRSSGARAVAIRSETTPSRVSPAS